MAITVSVDGIGDLEFPDGTSNKVIDKAVASIVSSQKQKEIKPLIPKKQKAEKKPSLLQKLSEPVSQFQKGVEIQEREFGNLLGVEPPERLTEVEEPKGFIQKSARFAGEVLAPSPAFGGVPGVGFAANSLAKAISTKALPVLAPIAKAARKSVGFVGEVLSSVPREFIEHAILKEVAGDSVFKQSKKSYSALGKRAQKAMNFVLETAGKEVEKEVDDLIPKNIVLKADDLIPIFDKMIEKRSVEGISLLSKEDLKVLNSLKKGLIPDKNIPIRVNVGTGKNLAVMGDGKSINEERIAGITAAKLNQIKRVMQGLAEFDQQTVKKTSDQADTILKLFSEEIDKRLTKAVPELKKVNVKFSKLAFLKNKLRTKLKDENVERSIKSLINKDQFTKQLFFDLDQAAPKGMKFFNDLQSKVVVDAFDQLFPGSGGGSGSAAGFANILRVGGLTTTAPLALPLISPKVQGLAIKGGGKAGRALGKLPKIPPIAAAGTTGRSLLKLRSELEQ